VLEELARIVEKAKGDEETRNMFIQKYTPFILKTASEFSKKYIDETTDEEFSISLLAFNEAIDNYDSSRGVSFLTFARTIIRRRLIDHYRKTSRNQNVISIMTVDEENPGIEYDVSLQRFNDRIEQEERKNEIKEYGKMLYEFGISFDSLVKVCPRKKDARERAKEVARLIAKDSELSGYLMKYKLLPIKEIEKKMNLSRKTLERNRNYIIAIVLILVGDYCYLKDYIRGIEG
jgi:RNA polymerase sigma factor